MDVRLFVSHAGRDRAWAEWVTWHLRDAGYTVELASWHWGAGDNFVLRMSDALDKATRVVALWSEAYFERERFSTDEWTAVEAARGKMVPLRIEAVTAPGLLRSLVYRDLFGLDEEAARQALLSAVGGPDEPVVRPAFPAAATAAPPLPGTLPAVWNVPVRSAAFTGRDDLLLALREQLCTGGSVAVQALHGMGGVGKTTLAVEYAYRFAGGYDLVWWVDAEQPALIAEQVATLAVSAGWVARDADTPTALDTVRRRLRTAARWLVVFDNADSPDDLAAWLPQGPGHAVVTSRNPGWGHLAAAVQVDVFARAESVALLRRLTPAVPEPDADRIAAAVGDLPLAVAQAAGVVAETGMPADEYLRELAGRTGDLMSYGKPAGYPVPLAAAVRVAVDRLSTADPAGEQLLRLCALLAPEPVPVELFTGAPDGILPAPLDVVAGSGLALRRTIGRLGRYGLAKISPDGPQLHRLTQAIIADLLGDAERRAVHARIETMLVAAAPTDGGSNPVSWPRWARLLPHLLAADPASSDNAKLRSAASRAAWYLLDRGDVQTGRQLAGDLYRCWRERLGPDHRHTLFAAHSLAHAHRALGEYTEAHRLDQDTYTRIRRICGEDESNTLASAAALAFDLRQLGRLDEAYELDQETLARMRKSLGEDHPFTLTLANNLAADLRRLGQVEQARAVDEDTLARRRRVLGDDHPSTLTSANNLAINLRRLGRLDEARTLDEDTLARRRRVLGDDHPSTAASRNNLAALLADLGDHDAAKALRGG